MRIPWDNKEVYVGMRKEMGREKRRSPKEGEISSVQLEIGQVLEEVEKNNLSLNCFFEGNLIFDFEWV